VSLIPALIRGMAHYRHERERLDRRGNMGTGPDSSDGVDFGPGLDLGDAGDEIMRSFQKLGMTGSLPDTPTLRVPRPQYPQYKPPSE
jgi:hypothetical protein